LTKIVMLSVIKLMHLLKSILSFGVVLRLMAKDFKLQPTGNKIWNICEELHKMGSKHAVIVRGTTKMAMSRI
ncbi:hypothetical protein M8C21_018762, partial [Ambrosia artemisiifolia]